MLYCGLRGEVSWDGWHIPIPGWDSTGTSCNPSELTAMVDQARQSTRHAVDRMLAGDFEVNPADPKVCEYCDYRDACRVESQRLTLVQVAGA